MPGTVEVIRYDSAWRGRFIDLATPIRAALGKTALRIDHIGSTAVVGLDAKPVIDIQISVAEFEPFELYGAPLADLGYTWRTDNPDLTKRYFREPAGQQRTHIHVRRYGSWSEQVSLLFRDYLRAHDAAAQRYGVEKHRMAGEFGHDRERYTEAKGPIIWEIMRAANEWSQLTGWQPGPSDA